MEDSRIEQISKMAEEGSSLSTPSNEQKLAIRVKDYLAEIAVQRSLLAELDDEATQLSGAIEKHTAIFAEMGTVRSRLLEVVREAEIDAVTAGKSEVAVGLRKKLQIERRALVEHDSRMEEASTRIAHAQKLMEIKNVNRAQKREKVARRMSLTVALIDQIIPTESGGRREDTPDGQTIRRRPNRLIRRRPRRVRSQRRKAS